jgi:putative ABC transport system permease protein
VSADPNRPRAALVETLRRRIGTFFILQRNISRRQLQRHPGHTALVLITVSLGVSAVVATGSLVESAVASLHGTWRAAGELADLRIANGFAGVPDALIESVREIEGVEAVAGILTGSARAHLEGSTEELVIVAVDLLGDDAVYGDAISMEQIAVRDPTDFLARPEAIALARDFAEAHGLELGSTFEADLRTGRRELFVAGLLEPSRASALFGGALALMDLPAGQAALGRGRLVEAIDVRVDPAATIAQVKERIEARVSGRATVRESAGTNAERRSLLFNIRLVLGVAGAIALVVGSLVIYNAVAIAVSQRKPQLDVLRAVGASRRSVFAVVCSEALALGAVGSVVGAGLGILLARAAAGLFEQAVGTLYWPLATSSFRVSGGSLLWGGALGMLIPFAASIAPALETTRLGGALIVASPRRERQRRAFQMSALGVVAIAFGLLAPALEQPGIEAETLASVVTVGDVLILLGLGLVAPLVFVAIAPIASRWLEGSRVLGLRLAWQGVTSDPARSATVMTSIMVGTAYVIITVGVVGSLRGGVLRWLARSQQADVVVSGAGSIGLLPSAPAIPSDLRETLAQHPDVLRVQRSRLVAQPYEDRWVVLFARDPEAFAERESVTLVAGDLAAAQRAMRSGTGVIASEHFATKHGRSVGDTIELRTPTGPARFRIEAVVVDYSGDLGTIFVAPEVLASRWLDPGVTSFQLWLRHGANLARARESIEAAIRERCDCAVLTREEIGQRGARIVDASFHTAYALQLVAVVVMIVSVIGFFSITLNERRREIELLRTIGATGSQLLRRFLWEAAVIGSVAGMLGCASGLFLASRIVTSTIRVGGGMVLDFTVPVEALVATLGAAVAVSLLAALGPVWRSTRPLAGAPLGERDE